MNGKVAGIPLVLIILALLIDIPLGLGLLVVSGQLTTTRQDVLQTRITALRCVSRPEAVVTPTATVSVTPVTPAVRSFTKPATPAGQTK